MPVADLLQLGHLRDATQTLLSAGVVRGDGIADEAEGRQQPLRTRPQRRRDERAPASSPTAARSAASSRANAFFPDDSSPIAVLTNQEASPAAGAIGRALPHASCCPPAPSPQSPRSATARARDLDGPAAWPDRSRRASPTTRNFYFDAQALGDFASSLAPLGAIESLHQTATFDRGGMTYRGFAVRVRERHAVNLSTFTVPDGQDRAVPRRAGLTMSTGTVRLSSMLESAGPSGCRSPTSPATTRIRSAASIASCWQESLNSSRGWSSPPFRTVARTVGGQASPRTAAKTAARSTSSASPSGESTIADARSLSRSLPPAISR